MAQTYKFGNGTWATKKGSTLAYNDEDNNFKPLPFSFERDSIATRVNKEGLIEVVGNNIPRIDYTDSTEGALLLENSATNLITYSSDLSVLSKVSTGTASSPSTTANYAIAPDGTMTATRVVFDLNGGTTSGDRSILRQSISNGDYYISIYVKSTNGTEQKVMWHDGGEFNTTTITNQWSRITYDTRSGISYVGIALNGVAGADTSDILIWGFQAEIGSYPTSYIPTNGSTVQRAAETCNGSGNSEVFNDSEGVLFADVDFKQTESLSRYISVNDGGSSDRVLFGVTGNSNTLRGFVYQNSQTPYQIITTINLSNNQKIALSYKSNSIKLYVNGFGIDEITSAIMPSGLNTLSFNDSVTANFYGETKELGYYDAALTDEELEYMTSYRSLNEMVTELNLNTL